MQVYLVSSGPEVGDALLALDTVPPLPNMEELRGGAKSIWKKLPYTARKLSSMPAGPKLQKDAWIPPHFPSGSSIWQSLLLETLLPTLHQGEETAISCHMGS